MGGITPDDKALVVSRKGNPDGLIARSSLEQIADEQVAPDSSASLQNATVMLPDAQPTHPDRSVSQADHTGIDRAWWRPDLCRPERTQKRQLIAIAVLRIELESSSLKS